MKVGLIVHGAKWTGAAAVAELSCRALRVAGVDARLLFVGGRNLERRLAGRSWALPELVKERSPTQLRANLGSVKELRESSDIVVCHLPHDHLLCVASGVARHLPLVRAYRSPSHIRRDPYHRSLDLRLSGALLAHSEMEKSLGGLAAVAMPVPLEDRFRPVDASGVRALLGIPAKAPVIGSVGKLARGRGFELLLDTASRVESSIHVVVAGHGETLPRLRKRAARLGIAGRVHWTGYQAEGLPQIYAAMDVFLFCAPGSDWGHRSISEAQGCGRPVVAVSWPGVEDLIADGLSGRVIDGNPTALASSIDSLISDREAARLLGNAALQAAEQRRMVPVGTRYAQFLERILAV
jgi:glycosyltransferase involved in cell wall biosynthesis